VVVKDALWAGGPGCWCCVLGGTARSSFRCMVPLGRRLTMFVRDADIKWFLPSRLETRTKESNICASARVPNPGRVMKVKGGSAI
jgi:hypothetical protein